MSAPERLGVGARLHPAYAGVQAPVVDPALAIERTGRWFLVVVVATWVAGLALGFERALTVLVTIGFVGAVAGLSYPALGLLSVALLCALDTPSRVYMLVGGLLRYNTFNYWLVITVILGLSLVRRLNDPHSRLLQAFVLLLAVELLVSPNLTFGMQHVLNVAAPFGLIVYFAPAASSALAWYWLGVATGAAGAAGGLLYYLQRGQLTYINGNAWALFPLTALFAICLAYPFAMELRRGRLTLMLLTLANCAWVFLSGSRGGLLMATVCVMYVILVMRGVGGRLTFLLVAGLVALAVSSQFTDLQAHTLHRIDRLFDSQVSLVGRTSGRSELTRGGWAIFVENPFGVGTGGFAHAWSQLSPSLRLSFGRGQEFNAHSAWVKVLAENGMPGIIMLIAYVGSFLVVGVLSHERQRWMLGMLVTIVLTAAFATTEFQSKGLWFLAAGVTTLLHRQRIVALLRERREE
jgi:hypothetical protein